MTIENNPDRHNLPPDDAEAKGAGEAAKDSAQPGDPAGNSVELPDSQRFVQTPPAQKFVPGLEPPVPGPNNAEGWRRLPDAVSEGFGPKQPLQEDLRGPWSWVDLVFLVVFWIGGTIVATVALIVVFQLRGINWVQLQQSQKGMSAFLIIDQFASSIFIMIYLVLYVRLRFNAPFWQTAGWRRLQTAAETGKRAFSYGLLVASGFVLAGLVQVASALFPAKTKLPIENFFQDRETALLLMLLSVLLAPLVEETIFRGVVYPVLARSFGIATSVVATGVLFGLLHAEQLKGGSWQIVLMVIVGVIFTWVRAAKRTVLASYLLHLSYNSCLFLAFLVSSDGLRSLPR